MPTGSKFALNINLIERNRLRGWIAILREGKGFLESNNSTSGIEPIAFSTSAFTGDSSQVELGDEVEFSLRKLSGRLTAENILKVPSTVNNSYVSKILLSCQYKEFDLTSPFFQLCIEVELFLLFVCSPTMNVKS